MLKLTKKGDKYWLFEDSEIGLFSPSKFTINLELNEIVIVYENGLKSKRYNVIDCEIYDLGELTPFTTSSGDLFMQKLEELNCPCFQKNENIFNISGGSWSELTDFDVLNDATLPLTGTEEIPIVQGGETKKVAVSSFMSETVIKTESVTISNRWTLTTADLYYRSRGDFGGFNVDTLNISTANSTIVQVVASLSGALYVTKVSKSLDKIYIDGSNMTSTLTSFKLGVFAFQRDNTATINSSAINIINLGEFTLSKTSGHVTHFWEVDPANIEIPADYLVSCVLMRTGGTGTEINCSMTFKFDDYVA